MKRMLLCMWLLVACITLGGCAAAGDPLRAAEATAVPGLSMRLHAATAAEDNVSETTATLYFRYMNQPMLASETRVLTVKRDSSAELALIKALLDGPSAGHVELMRLFPETVRAVSAVTEGDTLYVTLSEELALDDRPPTDPGELAAWTAEAQVRRRLALQSIAASVTETFSCSSVQFLLDSNSQGGARLDGSYLLSGFNGPLDPVARDEALLLTPHNTAQCLLNAWQARDFETLYAFTAMQDDFEQRPAYTAFAILADSAPTLTAFTATPGAVSQDGQSALVMLSLSQSSLSGARERVSVPLRLMRENGVWKVAYQTLIALMLA